MHLDFAQHGPPGGMNGLHPDESGRPRFGEPRAGPTNGNLDKTSLSGAERVIQEHFKGRNASLRSEFGFSGPDACA